MATQPLMPETVQAKPVRMAFNAAMAQFATAQARMRALPASATIHDEIAAGEALERAQVALADAPAPDHSTFATKLCLTLQGAGVDPVLIDRLTGDARRLARAGEVLA